MLENEFSQRYRAAQESTRPPADLVETTRTLVSYAQRNEADETSTNAGKPTKRRSRRLRWTMPIAACLAALLVLFGVGSAFLASGFPFMQEQAPAKAYAKTPNLLTAELGDGIVPFALDAHTAFQGWGDGESEEGSYTGMQFTIEGEGIARVQATISRGELYRITTETYDRTTEEGAAILEEAAGWKPTARGTGKYLRNYDQVTVYFVEDGLNRNDPNHKTQLRLIKRIGSTVDLPYEEEPLTFGLWFDNVGRSEGSIYPDLQSLDGTELTLTAEYADGTFRTQKMMLHDGWFTTSPTSTDQGADSVMAEGPYETQPKNSFDKKPYYDPTYTLYGEVTSITDQPHPYSLENANEHANAPVGRMPLFNEPGFTPSTGTTAIEGTPKSENIHPMSNDLAVGQWSYERNDWADLHWSDISAYITDTLPASIDLYQNTEVWAFTGNIEYMNMCRLQTNHWSVDEQGRVNDDNSFVVLDVTVTNAEDEEVMFSGRDIRGSLCAMDEEAGAILFADGGLFGAADNFGRTWGHGGEDSFRLGPGESLRLHMAFIADNAIAEADEVLFTVTNLYEFDKECTDEPTSIADAEFISLGKLERR